MRFSYSNILEDKTCDVCGSSKRKNLYEWPPLYYDHDKFITYSWDGGFNIPLKIVSCKKCKFVYTSPAFKEQSLEYVYPEEVVPEFSTIDINNLKSNTKWNHIIDIVGNKVSEDAVIFDIGTRYGILPYQLSLKGYRSYGIDYNKKAVAVGNTILPGKIFHGGISTLSDIINNEKLSTVNVFILDDVLEHLAYPTRDLNVLSNFQNKGDYLILRQMDLDSLGAKIYRKNWYYFQPAAHMGYFNENSAKALLNKVNYEIESVFRSSIKSNLHSLMTNLEVPNNGPLLRRLLVAPYFFIKRALTKQLPLEKEILNNPYYKQNYLLQRKRLNDMFLIVAKKR